MDKEASTNDQVASPGQYLNAVASGESQNADNCLILETHPTLTRIGTDRAMRPTALGRCHRVKHSQKNKKVVGLLRRENSISIVLSSESELVLAGEAEVKSEDAPGTVLPRIHAEEAIVAREISFAVMPVCGFAAKDQPRIT